MAMLTALQALAKLKVLVVSDAVPMLEDPEIQLMLDDAALATVYASSTIYNYNDQVLVPVNGRYYRCVAGGTTSDTVPVWPTNHQSRIGYLIVDGTVTWNDAGEAWPELWDIRAAARNCWILKASKAAELVSSSDGPVKMEYEQIRQNCMAQAKAFQPRLM